jgi:hypothetical protein
VDGISPLDQPPDAVQVATLRKALDSGASAAASLLAALPDPPKPEPGRFDTYA